MNSETRQRVPSPPQTLLFAFLACCAYGKKGSPKALPAHAEDRWLRPWVAAYGLANGVMSLSAYVAVKLAPISDVIVFCYTSLVFTIAFSACILRSGFPATFAAPSIGPAQQSEPGHPLN